jgi:DNA adenine methylase
VKRSPLRYPGGKSRAVKHILPYFPEDLTSVCSPFFGGGSVELALADKGVFVAGYDKFLPLVSFWQSLIWEKPLLHSMVLNRQNGYDKERFKKQQAALKEEQLWDRVAIGAVFYCLNRSSFSGTVLSGGYSPGHPRFNERSVQRILDFDVDNFIVEHADFKESIPAHPEQFLYCDPPYYVKSKLYGNRGDLHEKFDHEGLAELLTKRDRWILSYNDCPEILDLYKGHEIVYPEWKYGMSQDKKSKEILIIKY